MLNYCTEYVEGKDLYSRAIRKCPKEFTENKSVFYSNRAACSQKMVCTIELNGLTTI